MGVLGILGNIASSVQGQFQHAGTGFKKHCHDQQVGNDRTARADVVSLSQAIHGQGNAGGVFGQMLSSIGQALQSGDLSAAKDVVDAIAKVGPCAVPKGAIVPPMAAALSEGVTALGDALKAGDLSAAKQSYSVLQEVWGQMTQPNASGVRTLGNSSGVSVRI